MKVLIAQLLFLTTILVVTAYPFDGEDSDIIFRDDQVHLSTFKTILELLQKNQISYFSKSKIEDFKIVHLN